MKKINGLQLRFLLCYLMLCVFWAALFVSHTNSGDLNYYYSFLFGLIPFAGGLIGMFKAKIWGGMSSAMGRAVFFISLGLFLWGLGENIWSYYNFIKDVPAPYPSAADIGFAPSIFFWIIGAFYLSKATGALYNLKKNHWAKVLAIVIPLAILIPSYYIQIQVARGGVLVPEDETTLKTVLDIAYPFGDFLAVTFAALVFTLSYKYLGGLYRQAVIAILVGLAVMYVGDSVFSYSTTKGTYYNADWGDLLLSTGVFLITFGVLAFAVKPKNGLPKEED
jgi:hypothetical protein